MGMSTSKGEISVQNRINWINNRAKLFPNDIAIIDADSTEKFTYEEMNERAKRLARFLYAKGVRKGDRIAHLAPNHVSYFDLLFASMHIGSIFVPLNWRLSSDELYFVIHDCSPSLIFIHDTLLNEYDWIKEKEIVPFKNNDYIEKNYTNDELPQVDLYEKDPLAMIYTGGTTANPKGAVLSYQSIFWNAINTIVSWNLEKDDITLTTIPMFHTGGLNALSIPVLIIGGTVVIRSSFDPVVSIGDLINYECTIVLFIPTMYHMIIQTETFKKAEFPKMKVFLSGGAPCPLTVYDAFQQKGLKFKEGYGLTEAGPNNFYIDPGKAELKRGSVGQSMMFNDIKIVNDDGEEVAYNEVGELWLQGHHLFEYYWNNEEATLEVYEGDWFKTGDLGVN